CERGATRPDRGVRPRHAHGEALARTDGLLIERGAGGDARPRPPDPHGPRDPRAPQGARGRRRGIRPRHVGRARQGGPARDRVAGVKTCVPAGLVADRVLVPASAGDDGTIVVLIVDPTANGVTRERQDTTSGIPEARLELDGVQVAGSDVLGDPDSGAAIVDW